MEGIDWRRFDDPEPPAPAPAPPSSAPRLAGARWLAAGLVAVAAAFGSGALLLAATTTPTRSLDLAAAAASASPTSSAALLVVDVEGAVRHPGIYHLPAGSRVADAVAAAGGYDASLDTAAAATALNLAQSLRDGAKVEVPARGSLGAASPSAAATAGRGHPIDLNVATLAELDALPGVGPATAAKIVASREEHAFTRIDELTSRKLVSSTTFEKLRDLVSVGG